MPKLFQLIKTHPTLVFALVCACILVAFFVLIATAKARTPTKVAGVTDLSAEYSAKDHWSASLKNMGADDRFTLTLVGRSLIVYQVNAGASRVTDQIMISATSRCSTG